MQFLVRAMDNEPAGRDAVEQDNLEFRVGKGLVTTLARPKLQGEEGVPHFRWPAPGIQLLLASAGMQFEEEGLIGRLFGADGDGIQAGRHNLSQADDF
jgi:hypothetical protein